MSTDGAYNYTYDSEQPRDHESQTSPFTGGPPQPIG
jgi:hypothetical protein